MEESMYGCGQVYWAKLNGTGHMQRGQRPVIIAQDNIANEASPTLHIVPLTKQHKAMHIPVHVPIAKNDQTGLDYDSIALIEQMQLINKNDLIKYMGHVTMQEKEDIKKGIRIHMKL